MAVPDIITDAELERLCDPRQWLTREQPDECAQLGAELAKRLFGQRGRSDYLTEALRGTRELLVGVAENVKSIADALKQFEE